ncbi:predicted protein [Postia placenta Mad-698-R]|nr:predicted protein [Postia placenta Mad-698-R]
MTRMTTVITDTIHPPKILVPNSSRMLGSLQRSKTTPRTWPKIPMKHKTRYNHSERNLVGAGFSLDRPKGVHIPNTAPSSAPPAADVWPTPTAAAEDSRGSLDRIACAKTADAGDQAAPTQCASQSCSDPVHHSDDRHNGYKKNRRSDEDEKDKKACSQNEWYFIGELLLRNGTGDGMAILVAQNIFGLLIRAVQSPRADQSELGLVQLGPTPTTYANNAHAAVEISMRLTERERRLSASIRFFRGSRRPSRQKGTLCLACFDLTALT